MMSLKSQPRSGAVKPQEINFPEEGPIMIRNAFKMKLSSGDVEEYKRRHDAIWPELITELRKAGIRDYSIYYDPETRILFAFQKLADDNTADGLPQNPVVRKWWDTMNDGIMEYDDRNEPVSIPLTEVFHMD
jgi:L-rhamnose mutarotase